MCMSRYIHTSFNDSHMNANCAREWLLKLRGLLEDDHIEMAREVNELIADATNLQNRIDRLHTDFPNDELAEADQRIGG